MSETLHRGIRLALASFLAVALISQLLIGLSRGDLTIIRFFGHFAVLSNTAAVATLLWLSARPGSDASPWFASVRGAVTVYMSLTGLAFAVLVAPKLANVAAPEPWIDWATGVVGPIVMVLDWFFFPPPVRLWKWSIPVWLIFPAAYLGYSVTRGVIVDWYPYPLLDPDEAGGLGWVSLWTLVVLVASAGLGLLFYWWGNRSRGEPDQP